MKTHSITPWKIFHAHEHAYIRNIKDAQGELIAQVCDFDNGFYGEALSNARLMAAAPDLLSALQGMIEYFCENGYDDYSDTETVQAAHAAIAKATANN